MYETDLLRGSLESAVGALEMLEEVAVDEGGGKMKGVLEVEERGVSANSSSPWTSGTVVTNSLRKSNRRSASMHCFLKQQLRPIMVNSELCIALRIYRFQTEITYRCDGVKVFAFLAFVTISAFLSKDSTKSSRARGKHTVKENNCSIWQASIVNKI